MGRIPVNVPISSVIGITASKKLLARLIHVNGEAGLAASMDLCTGKTIRSFTQAAIARSLSCCLALAATALVTWAQAQQADEPPPTRGQLLYTTHCIECHTTRMHWRNQRQARDWDTLKAQVRLWQEVASLGWSEADIDEVTRYLNDAIYQFPRQVSRLGRNTNFSATPLPGSTGSTGGAAITP